MRISVKLIPMGTKIKMEIRGAHSGSGTYCKHMNRQIATGNRTFDVSNRFGRSVIERGIFRSMRAFRRFMKQDRPINMIIESAAIPQIIERCDMIG